MATQRLPAEQRRKQLVLASIPVFARHGFHGATTKAIAREASVAESLIYRYFPSKHELFAAAVELTASRLVRGLDEILRNHGERPDTALASLLAFYRSMLDRNQDLAKMIFLVSAELEDPAIRAVYVPHQKAALRVIQEAIEKWQEHGHVRRTLPSRAAAWLIMGSFQVVALMKQSGQLGELDVKPAIELVSSFLSASTSDDGQKDDHRASRDHRATGSD